MIKFYLILIFEAIFSPVLYLIEVLKKLGLLPVNYHFKANINRKEANADKLLVCIHDWAGYDLIRKKRFKNGKEIECGLSYQIERFINYKGEKSIEYLVTISDIEQHPKEKYEGINIKAVSNIGFDFSGYGDFVENLRDENCYILLMNTSVEKTQTDFIDDYIDYMESNPSIGLLGISYSTKKFQTLIRNNFEPHVQSFFLLTTSDILKQISIVNNGFPGKFIKHKRLLIREGELKISSIIKRMGYSLAIISENGQPFIFPTSTNKYSKHKMWKMPYGDYRYAVDTPNKINRIISG